MSLIFWGAALSPGTLRQANSSEEAVRGSLSILSWMGINDSAGCTDSENSNNDDDNNENN